MTLATAEFDTKLAYWKGEQDHIEIGQLEERFRVLVEMATDGLWIVDIHTTRVLYANPACAGLFGYTVEEMEGMSVLQLHPPEVVASVQGLFERVLEEGRAGPVELWGLTKLGDRVCVEINPSIIELRGARFMMGVARDITERRQAEEERETLFSLIQNSDDIIALTTLDGYPIFINEAGLRMMGCDGIEAAVLHPVHRFHPRDEWDTVTREIFPTVIESGHWEGDLHIQNLKTGILVPVQFHVFTIKNPSTGEPIAVAAIARDLTERKQLEAQLLQSQKMESIGQLAGGIAHDFNNLLTPILGYSQMAAVGLSPEHPIALHLHEITRAAERASNLTRQLLAFSRRQIIEPKALDLNELVMDTGKLIRRLIGEDIELATLPCAEMCRVKADPGQLEQVLINLVVNARDAMPNGGKLIIATHTTTLDPKQTSPAVAPGPSTFIVLSVTDTGTGMTEEVTSHVFEPFFTTKEVGKGTGLGLATCYGIVTQNGGKITINSAPGQGSTFNVYLPQVFEEVTSAATDEKRNDLPSGTENVLLVEDETSVREFAASVLAKYGYNVLVAANGVEALQIVQDSGHQAIDLLLTDVVMPLMVGTDLADRVRSAYPEIDVLYTSGYTDDAIVHHGVLNPGVHFLGKPYSAASLLQRVREVINRC